MLQVEEEILVNEAEDVQEEVNFNEELNVSERELDRETYVKQSTLQVLF